MWIWKLTTKFEYQILVKLFSLGAQAQASAWNVSAKNAHNAQNTHKTGW